MGLNCNVFTMRKSSKKKRLIAEALFYLLG